MAKSKYDRPVTHSDSYKYLHQETGTSSPAKGGEARRRLTPYRIAIYEMKQTGATVAHGSKELQATKKRLSAGHKRGTFRFEVTKG